MLFLLGIILLLITIIMFSFTRDVMHPGVILPACYFLSVVFALMSKTILLIDDISSKTVFIVGASCIIFCFFSLCEFGHKEYSYSDKVLLINIPSHIKILILIIIASVTVLYLRYILGAAYLGGYGGGLRNIFSYAQKTLYSDDSDISMGFILNYGLKFSRSFAYIVTVELIQKILYRRHISIIDYLVPIIYVFQCIISTGRTKLFYYAIFVLFVAVILKRQIKGNYINDNRRLIKIIIRVAVVLLAFFVFSGLILRGSIYGHKNTIWNILSVYIGGPVFCLDNYLKNPTYASSFGEETLYSIYGVLNKIGLDIKVSHSYLEFTTYGLTQIKNNVYGAIRRYIHDYQYFTILILSIEGYVFGHLYRKIRSNGGSSFLYIFYSLSIYAIVFFFFEERFIIDVLSTSNLLSMLAAYFLYKVFTIKVDLSDLVIDPQN